MEPKILLLVFCLTTTCFAQKSKPIEADRPDQTETPAIVPKGMFQAETGFTFQKNNLQNQSWNLPSTLWKYGLNENLEVRLITELVYEKTNDEKSFGLSPVWIGFKVRLCEESGLIPKTSFIGHMSLPHAASSNFKKDFSAPEFRFTMQHTLSDKMTLGYNLGCEWDGITPLPTYVYTLTTGLAVTDKLGIYTEVFGFASQAESANHNLDGGMTYLITDNFMVDLSSGVGLTDIAPEYYFALGFSFRY
ncbi:transporter [Flavobacterium silvisoli]|uniref:Transporter n=1 Tax=Flavobacterium silvisoli TaxID=2529433 RepID=A0A4Q9Z4G2_9FLAO|nr:transporter [Flavobacterium silvisoli]TBX71343.1 transporter [Flavobacterium silvisoli]